MMCRDITHDHIWEREKNSHYNFQKNLVSVFNRRSQVPEPAREYTKRIFPVKSECSDVKCFLNNPQTLIFITQKLRILLDWKKEKESKRMTAPSTRSTAISRPDTWSFRGGYQRPHEPLEWICTFLCIYLYTNFLQKQSMAFIRVSKGFLTSKCLPMLRAMVTWCVV